jgi:hypothetical protein
LGKHKRLDFDDARDRLFVEIQRCGVLQAADEDVEAWLEDTVEYLDERFPSLSESQLRKLKRVGRNYVAPIIPHGKGKDARNRDEWVDEADTLVDEETLTAGAEA